MSYIQLNYQTWEREECYGMFDYSEQKNIKTHQKIVLKTSGILVRNKLNYQMKFQTDQLLIKNHISNNYIPFLKIELKEEHFIVQNYQNQDKQEKLSIIIPKIQKGYKLNENQKIKLGRSTLSLIKVNWKRKNTKNHYEQMLAPNLAQNQSIIAASFYSQKEKASMIQTNPACRYCYSKTIDESNPFLVACNCSGSTKYIHQSCLIEWVKKRSGIQHENIKQGIYYSQAKAFTCEVCNSLYKMDRLLKHIFYNDNEFSLEQYAIFYISGEPPMIYVIDLQKINQIIIGRSLQSTITVNELSVSRRHCYIKIDKQKKSLNMFDLSAKFGTVVQINRSQITNMSEFQKGRTKMQFKKYRKLSFFEKIGICSSVQNYENERKSFNI